ncbi:MAG: hypothetical protein AAB932_00520, partial [Patescibacteria group bacterium]
MSFLKSKIHSKRARIATGLLFAFLVCVGVAAFIVPAYAALGDGAVQGTFTMIGNGIIYAITQLSLLFARLAIGMTIFFLKLFIELAKYNNYINAGPVVLGWVMVRDIANMFFVVALLAIAFGTILGVESYEWKKTLVKLILAAIFINFSKLIAGAIIDIAHVFTITFVNAVGNAAGGNLINMFKFQEIMALTGQELNFGENYTGDLRLDLLMAGAMAAMMAGIAMMTLGAYLIVMLLRMVILWVLIILSPIAFIAQVLPNTKSYASEWWDEFTKHVLVAPIMVFFLWLAFATLGTGNIAAQLDITFSGTGGPEFADRIGGEAAASIRQAGIANTGKKPSVSLLEASTWENLSNFLIAIAFMWVGLERVQKLGVRGGGLTQGAMKFAKNVATIASGYAVGRWIVGGATKGAEKAGKGALWHMPFIGGEKWAMRAKTVGHSLGGWYHGKGGEMTEKGDQKLKERNVKSAQLKHVSDEKEKKIDELGQTKEALATTEKAIAGETDDEKKRALEKTRDDLTSKKERLDTEITQSGDREKTLKGEVDTLDEGIKKEMGGGIVGRLARQGLQTEKRMEKTQKQAKTRRDILWKRTGSEAGGYLVGMGTKGIGLGKARIFADKYKLHADKYTGSEAQDRLEQGWLKAEEERSDAKTAEFQALGRKQVLEAPRLKYSVDRAELQQEWDRGKVADQIAS